MRAAGESSGTSVESPLDPSDEIDMEKNVGSRPEYLERSRMNLGATSNIWARGLSG
jgi:hypothetical protein